MKFNLCFSTDGQNRLILYDQFQIIYFLHLVSPWMNAAMDRKALVNLPLRPIAKRMIIYLPAEIHTAKPTASQIVVQDDYRETLASIRRQTGLTVSQMVTYCFFILNS